MNKKQIWVLTIVASVATIILITVQVIWIQNTRTTRMKDFQAAISIVLTRVVDAVWKEETVTQIYNLLPNQGSKSGSQSPVSVSKEVSRDAIKYTQRSQEIISNIDSFTASRKMNPLLKNSAQGANFDSLQEKDRNTLLSSKQGRRIVMEQIVEQIIVVDLPIEQRVTIEQLDTLMRAELALQGIVTPFEVAVSTESGMVIMRSTNYFPIPESASVVQLQLFPNDPDFVEKNYLNLYFPSQNTYILQSLWVMIIISFGLTALILAIFVSTLVIILRQKKLSEIRSHFVSNITHELKTPIATISLAAQMLEDNNIPVELKNIPYLSKMMGIESKKLTFLVEKVLQMSVFDKGDFEFRKTDIDVHVLIKKALNSFALQLREKNFTVIMNLDASDTVISADDVHFYNALSNLIDNAIKYSDKEPSLTISTMNKHNGILVTITDNGIGINKDYQKRIFDQFFRVPMGNVHNVKGFGLGLSYVRQTIENLGGTINVESEPGEGTSFEIWMPLDKIKL